MGLGRAWRVALCAAVALVVMAEPASAFPPHNDDFADAEIVGPGLPLGELGGNTDATAEVGEPGHHSGTAAKSVWYSWTPAVSGPVEIDTCTANFDTKLAVYTGSAVHALTLVASNDDDADDCGTLHSRVAFTAAAGTTYRIAVDGFNGLSGGFVLVISGPLANDDFADATTVGPALPVSRSVANSRATAEAGEPAHGGSTAARSVWFNWTPAVSETVEIDTCKVIFDTVLHVYTGSAVNALTPVAGNDDAAGCVKGSRVTVAVTAGTTYRIAVDGVGGARGVFTLGITARPPNDNFTSAQTLGPALPVTQAATNAAATAESGETAHAGSTAARSVWFNWTPAVSETVEIDTCAAPFDTLLAVYTGSAVNALTPVVSNDNASGCGAGSRVRFGVTAGTTYRIAVDGKDDEAGAFTLRLAAQPANDDFANAQTVGPGLPVSRAATNAAASAEGGEPSHAAGGPARRSVWFNWTPAVSEMVKIDTCTATFDTRLAVYTGSAVNALTPVAVNDDDPNNCGLVHSRVEFAAVAGTTYRIAVDGDLAESGAFTLAITGPPPPPPPPPSAECLAAQRALATATTALKRARRALRAAIRRRAAPPRIRKLRAKVRAKTRARRRAAAAKLAACA